MTTEPCNIYYDKILNRVSKIISHPHTYVTMHDKHRAIVLIGLLSDNDDMVEYLYSQLTQEEHNLIKQIKNFVYDKEITH